MDSGNEFPINNNKTKKRLSRLAFCGPSGNPLRLALKKHKMDVIRCNVSGFNYDGAHGQRHYHGHVKDRDHADDDNYGGRMQRWRRADGSVQTLVAACP